MVSRNNFIKINSHGDKRVCCMSMRDMYNFFEYKTKYVNWIDRYIKKLKLKEGVDYFKEMKESTGGRPSCNHMFTLDLGEFVFQRETFKMCFGGNKKEYVFFSQLEEVLSHSKLLSRPHVLYQYKILEYRVDCYFPDYNICIEYDEIYHNAERQKKKDAQRQARIELEGDYTFIRVKEGQENKGIGEIIKELVKKQSKK